MSQNIDNIEWDMRASQTIRTFAPGAIYDNTKDSVMMLGTDYWDQTGFGSLSDPYLLSQIRGGSRYFANLKWFASVSSPKEGAYVPVATFPTWGVCSECGMLQRRRGRSRGDDFRCRSGECSRKPRSTAPQTVPVRFVVACENGHIDDFPFYEWVHRKKEQVDKCPSEDALLYMEDRESGSGELDSMLVVCRNCGLNNNMGMALTEKGILHTTASMCSGTSPWLRERGHKGCGLPSRGMLKGATNIYFPFTRGALTIPPFSDELSQTIIQKWSDIEKFARKPSTFEDFMGTMFEVKDPENPDGRYTIEQVMDKYKTHKEARSKDRPHDILELEFKELNSKIPVDDKEFKMAPTEVPEEFRDKIDGITLVEKLRQVVTVTGFTRLRSPDDLAGREANIAPISSSPPEWLPAVENRGEGVFLSLNTDALAKWESDTKDLQDRMHAIQSGQSIPLAPGRIADARYVMLHSLSHLLIRAMSDLAGYSTSSLQERVYSSSTTAGILIFTSSPSSDGSLGGLVEQGRPDRIGRIIKRAVSRATSCSSDPLCSFTKPSKISPKHGAACHACMFLPETSCERMNQLLDRSMICRTLEDDRGFFS